MKRLKAKRSTGRRNIAVTLDPDVAAVFPSAREANDALRALVGVIRRHRGRRSSRRNA